MTETVGVAIYETKVIFHAKKSLFKMTFENFDRSAVDDCPEALPEKSKSMKKRKSKVVSPRFVPHDHYMAKILQLLKIDLKAIDNNKKARKGYAKVDRNWINQIEATSWSDAFDEDGHLRLTQVMQMLPMVTQYEVHISLLKSYRRLKSAVVGLAEYNRKNPGGEYYLVRPINTHPSLTGSHHIVNHTNFLAKRKDNPESPVELFFAEVEYLSDEAPVCCPLEPRLLPSDIVPPLETAFITKARLIHPEGFDCRCCNRKIRYL